MHRFYLRELYWKNKLIEPDAIKVAGQTINLARIKQPLYMVSAEEDHIAPWKQTFSLVHRTGGPVKFTLSSSGHIIGIINPPGPKCKRTYWQGEAQPGETADEWQSRQENIAGSWWPNWVEWLRGHSGNQVKPKLSSRAHSNQGPAPGKYVLE
jgi:polyhydroxyalkanoate synthase